MANGVKISELEEATQILQSALIEVVQSGDNFKAPYSLLVPIIEGIGTAASNINALTGISFDDLTVFTMGTIVSVYGENLEIVNLEGPDTGLNDTDLVQWHVFTLGTGDEVVQIGFSSYATAQKIKIRFANIISEVATWSQWSNVLLDNDVKASSLPYAYLSFDESIATHLTTGTGQQLWKPVNCVGLLKQNNMFSVDATQKITYTGSDPFLAKIQYFFNGYFDTTQTGAAPIEHVIRLNQETIDRDLITKTYMTTETTGENFLSMQRIAQINNGDQIQHYVKHGLPYQIQPKSFSACIDFIGWI